MHGVIAVGFIAVFICNIFFGLSNSDEEHLNKWAQKRESEGNITMYNGGLYSPAVSVDRQKTLCSIVAYDKIRGFLNWPQTWFKKAALSQCTNYKVQFSEYVNGEVITKGTNVVIFHAPSHTYLGSQLTNKPKGVTYAMISMEQPKYAVILQNTKYLEQHMDLMITYNQAQRYPGTQVKNLPITYYPLNILPPTAVLKPAKAFKDKTGFGTGVSVVVFASNCKKAGASERYKYLEELMKWVKVHSYGSCLNNRKEPDFPIDPDWPPTAQRRASKIKIVSQYKFYLAFENAPVLDYVSEKVFEGLIAGSVPVYRGTNTIHNFMPCNSSFINANGMTPKQLATLLNTLAKDERKYSAFLDFKAHPLPARFVEMAWQSYVHPNVLCRICDYHFNHLKKNKNQTDIKMIT